MKWTIQIELTPDGNPPITYDIGSISRPIADLSPEQIGLTLEEGQQLLRRVQVQMISSQAHVSTSIFFGQSFQQFVTRIRSRSPK